MCVLCIQKKDGSSFPIHSASLCLLIGGLIPFALKNFNVQRLLIPGILLLCGEGTSFSGPIKLKSK